jgi:hypothetical protein
MPDRDRAASEALRKGDVNSSPTIGTRSIFPLTSARLSAMPLPAPSSRCPGTASFWTRSCSHIAARIEAYTQATTSRSVMSWRAADGARSA